MSKEAQLLGIRANFSLFLNDDFCHNNSKKIMASNIYSLIFIYLEGCFLSYKYSQMASKEKLCGSQWLHVQIARCKLSLLQIEFLSFVSQIKIASLIYDWARHVPYLFYKLQRVIDNEIPLITCYEQKCRSIVLIETQVLNTYQG